MDKRYNINEVELKSQSIDIFSSRDKIGEYFTIILPPPNVTGSLHIGHALNSTLQDIIVRYKKMLGYDVLWQPGTDHAGIATQMVVERDLLKKGIYKDKIGRDEFVAKVWEWKEKSNNTILDQLSKLGCLCDWDRSRFTMDQQSSEAVIEAFIDLYEKNLIYKSKRLVNWDCVLQTAISDLEVNKKELPGKLYYIRYPIVKKDQSIDIFAEIDWNNFIKNNQFLVVATTRPETLFGDAAIAINPKDQRFEKLTGYQVLVPEAKKFIPIIADDYVDLDYGSGLVKITPGHDFNDYEVGIRNNLSLINVLNIDGTLNCEVPEKYQDLDRFVARKLLVENLSDLGLIEKIEDIEHSIPYGDRSDSVIEPMLTDQWMLDVKPLAEIAVKVVENGQIKFVSDNWKKIYLDWMYNIQPWCISRQLWWGHRIPVWYDDSGNFYAARNIDEAKITASKKLGKNFHEIDLIQETDVLDTWFSSALWPMTTLNWPQKLDEIKLRYPTDILFTGFDIIFFWVARMIMMGLHFQKDIPFKTVYIHGLICDENGQKMSKSKGNIIDPLEIISKYGADSLRFVLARSATYAKDICLSESRIESAHKFITKIWNLVRFADMNGCFVSDLNNKDFDPSLVSLSVNKWAVFKFSEMIGRSNDFILNYRFNDFTDNIYHFIWDDLCDWYVELSKVYLKNNRDESIEVKKTLYWLIKKSLLVLHPIMPHVTLYLLDFMTNNAQDDIEGNWPEFKSEFLSNANEFEDLIFLVKKIRSIKSQLSVGHNVKSSLVITNNEDKVREWIKNYWIILSNLCNLENYCFGNADEKHQGAKISDNFILKIDISFEEEIKRLKIDLENYKSDEIRIQNLLSNNGFAAKAPKNIILQEEKRLSDIKEKISGLQEFISLISK